MTDVKSTGTAEVSLGRLGLSLARYYLGNRWVLLILGGSVLLAGIGLNWSWLVAVGLAPILITLLPCAIMCAVGLCSMKMMGGSSEPRSEQSRRDAETTAEAGAALGVAKIDNPSAGVASCCHEQVGEPASPRVKQLEPIPAVLGIAKMGEPSAAESSWLDEQAGEPASPQVKQLEPTDLEPTEERRDSHA